MQRNERHDYILHSTVEPYGRYEWPLSNLAKVGVEGSNPFARSKFPSKNNALGHQNTT